MSTSSEWSKQRRTAAMSPGPDWTAAASTAIIDRVYLQAYRVDWGSVPDWIAGVGSVLAFAGFAIAFIWEVGKRRRDDERAAEERRDGLKRHARLVFTKVAEGSETQKRLTVHNEGSGPIFDIVTTVWIRSDAAGDALREVQLDRREPDVTELGVGESREVWLWLAAGEQILVGQEFFPQIELTDCDGNRWRRRDNRQPVRVVNTGDVASTTSSRGLKGWWTRLAGRRMRTPSHD